MLNGQDWRDWNSAGNSLPVGKEPAHASISMKPMGVDQFEALVSADNKAPVACSAYWTVTEHGHNSKLKAGESAGERLQLDYAVRQYTPAGDYRSDPSTPQKLSLRSISSAPAHARQTNLVIFDNKTGKTLQVVSAAC